MIDTHQHLIYPDRFSYRWAEGIPALSGAFPLSDYQKAADGCGITGTVFMEVDVGESSDEARFFCELAEESENRILGVIAAARPEQDGFEQYLDDTAHPKLKGIRRVLHTQPDELSQSPIFRDNVARLAKRDLTFDLCVLQRQLGIASELARACPETTFVLDHCGVPEIAANDALGGERFRNWSERIRALAAAPNVCCKISGLCAYAASNVQETATFVPYVETVLEAFGVERCVWGGDWPVCNLGAGLPKWIGMSREMVQALTPDEQHAVFTANAQQIYHL